MGGLNQIYLLSLLLKGFNALLECGLGAYLGIARGADLDAMAHRIFDISLFHSKGEWVAAAVFDYMASIPDATRNFFAIYLLLHGLAKVVLVGGLLGRRAWAYPLAMTAFSVFITYQTYEFSWHHAIGLLLLTVFDVIVLLLIINDYKQTKQMAAG